MEPKRYQYTCHFIAPYHPVETRGFEEEWQAMQYLDEQRSSVEELAANNGSGQVSRSIVDTHSEGEDRIVWWENIKPVRPTFEGHTERPVLHVIANRGRL